MSSRSMQKKGRNLNYNGKREEENDEN